MYGPSRQEMERQIRVMREYLHSLADRGDSVAQGVLRVAGVKVAHHICCACAGTGVNPSIDHSENVQHEPYSLLRGELR
jgi:hypothetical protein